MKYLAMAALTAAISLGAHDYLHHNVSDSVPVAWYLAWQDYTVARGDLVELCPPVAFDEESHARGYVENGPCPGGTLPFLKFVAAVANDTIAIDVHGVHVNGHLLTNSRAKLADHAGRPLVSQPLGLQRIPVGFVWLYGPNAWSADSRYYGPVPVNTIRYRARALIASAPLPDLR
jgi:conjugative transfer signal peptidase TraF